MKWSSRNVLLAMAMAVWRVSPRKTMIVVILTVLSGVAAPLLGFSVKFLTNAVIENEGTQSLLYGLLVGLAAMGLLVLNHFSYVPFAEASEIAAVSIESDLIELIHSSASLEESERPDFADRVYLVRRELGQLTDGMMGMTALASLIISGSLGALLLASVNPLLMALPISAVPALLAQHRAQRMTNKAREDAAKWLRRSTHLFRLATHARSAKEIKTLRLTDEVRRRHGRAWELAGRRISRAEWNAAAVNVLGQLVYTAVFLLAAALVVSQVASRRTGVGDVVLVIVLAAQMNSQMTTGLDLLRRLRRAVRGMSWLGWLEGIVSARRTESSQKAVPPARVVRGLELQGLSFSYSGSGDPALSDVSVTIPAGSVVAVVGENGAGKSTLIKLLCRFYSADSGRLAVDGTDAEQIVKEAWQARMAACFQDFFRFEFTVRYAIGVGFLQKARDDGVVLTALYGAGGADVADLLSDGLETQLGGSWRPGIELSGGQWQKIALARGLMRQNPFLVVLDEPTAAFDTNVEDELLERYLQMAKEIGRLTGAITLLVSHRYATARAADMVMMMEKGKVVEFGHHDQLMEANGPYAYLYRLQSGAYWRPGDAETGF